MGTTLSRMQLAQRIHQLLLREIDHAIEVERLLADPRYARDVLLVCEAVPGGELVPLAALFREASRAEAGHDDAPGYMPQANDWGRDTSGFGVSQPAPISGPVPLQGGGQGSTPGGNRRASDSEPGPLAPRPRSWLPRWRGPK